MNYKESKEILEEIEKVDKILLNCHRGADPDSIGSALAMRLVLLGMGKDVTIVSPTELDRRVDYLEGFSEIAVKDFDDVVFGEYDLFVALDSSSWDQVVDKSEKKPPSNMVVIDHHTSNTSYGSLNLVDAKASSIGEMLFLMFEDWGQELNKGIANCLMASIVGDTGSFKFTNTMPRTLEVAQQLMELGADKNRAVFRIFSSNDVDSVRVVGLGLSKMKVEDEIAWCAINNEDFEKYGKPELVKELLGSWIQTIKQTRLGIVMVEREPKSLRISFRSRGDETDVSKMAVELGGGGHATAAGAGIEGMSFDDAVQKVLKVARKHAQKNQKKDR